MRQENRTQVADVARIDILGERPGGLCEIGGEPLRVLELLLCFRLVDHVEARGFEEREDGVTERLDLFGRSHSIRDAQQDDRNTVIVRRSRRAVWLHPGAE